MLICEHEATEVNRPTRSRVGESLRRLQQNLEQTRKVESEAEQHFTAWQEKWSNRRDQIAQRLTLIDTQLEQLARDNRQKPQLSLVTSSPDTEWEPIMPMGPF